MFASIYIGLSGLNAYSRGLQQVSNNVTNLNTTGFKSSTVTFADLFGVSDTGGLNYANGSQGSGHGVRLGDAQIDFKQGELRQTGRDLDLAIDGTGFLVLLDGEEMLYTRTGSFEIDEEGYIVLANTDYRLATLDASGHPVSVSVDLSRTNPPQATTTIAFTDNLSSTATTYGVSDIKVYDATGAEHVWQVKFDKATDAGLNEWTVTVTDGGTEPVGTTVLKFTNGLVDPTTAKLTITDADTGLAVALDFSAGVTSFSSGLVSTLRKSSSDGRAVGSITTVTVNSAGSLEIGYSNGEKTDLGAIAIADFRDPQTLDQRGGGLFAQARPGQRDFLTSADVRAGNVVSNRLEASNVDLSSQFGDLILIQRGFQASSQLVSISNDMIQQLFGIRGQG
jgi:flagellar hook protein FlgE